MKYTISITKEEYDFILTAVDAYINNLRNKMADQAQTWLVRAEGNKIIATTKKAPCGLKKDGTLAKRRGRPAKKSSAEKASS